MQDPDEIEMKFKQPLVPFEKSPTVSKMTDKRKVQIEEESKVHRDINFEDNTLANLLVLRQQ